MKRRAPIAAPRSAAPRGSGCGSTARRKVALSSGRRRHDTGVEIAPRRQTLTHAAQRISATQAKRLEAPPTRTSGSPQVVGVKSPNMAGHHRMRDSREQPYQHRDSAERIENSGVAPYFRCYGGCTQRPGRGPHELAIQKPPPRGTTSAGACSTKPTSHAALWRQETWARKRARCSLTYMDRVSN